MEQQGLQPGQRQLRGGVRSSHRILGIMIQRERMITSTEFSFGSGKTAEQFACSQPYVTYDVGGNGLRILFMYSFFLGKRFRLSRKIFEINSSCEAALRVVNISTWRDYNSEE